MPRPRFLPRLVVACLVVMSAVAPAADGASTLTTGFADTVLDGSAAASPWYAAASASNAGSLKLGGSWLGIAQRRPARPADPADPAYNWSGLDAGVRGAVAHGFAPFISLTGAPAWAEGAHRPASAATGSWRPSGAQYRLFAQALARRYDGTYPDPLYPGAVLPRVSAFQPWNEPNLGVYLTPQFVKRSGRYRDESPEVYRQLLNGFYAGIKASQPKALVVSAGTAPYGDPGSGGRRMQPARFVRDLLCVSRALKPLRCPHPAHFDVLAHHPYSVAGPYRHAINADDASLPDLGRLIRPLRVAERTGRALGVRHHRVWVTEVSWDSSPPDPDGVPSATFTRWVAQALELLWRQGADAVYWYQLEDQAPVPSYAATSQSGMYLRSGAAKPAQAAFAFPLVVRASSAGRAGVWMRTPGAGTVAVQRQAGGRWVTVATLRATGRQVLQRRLSIPRGTTVRAVQGAATSEPYRYR